MAVYPFYIESHVEGKKTPIKGGCKRKSGEQTTHIYQRDRGEILEVFTVEQYSVNDDEGLRLVTLVKDRYGVVVASDSTFY